MSRFLADPSLAIGARLGAAGDRVEAAGERCVRRPEDQVLADDRDAAVVGQRGLDGGAVLLADPSAVSPAAFDADLRTAAALADRLLALLGVGGGDEAATELRRSAVVQLYAIALVLPTALFAADPIAGTDARGGLTELLRAAAGYERATPPDTTEAIQLADRAVAWLLADTRLTREGLRAALSEPALDVSPEPASEDDPDETDPEVLAAEEGLEEDEDDAPDEGGDEEEELRASGLLAASAGGKAVTRQLIRRLVKGCLSRAHRRRLRAWRASRRTIFRRHSGKDGLVAETAIRLAYLRAHRDHLGNIVLGRATGSLSLAERAASDPNWKRVRDGLLSTITNRIGEPDILDETRHTIYEIKPMGQVMRAVAQLYGRYLLWLNALEIADSQQVGLREAIRRAGALLKTFDPDLGGLAGGGPQPPFRPWLPGLWAPESPLPLPDGRMMEVERPWPGVLVYQILRTRKQKQDEKETAASRELAELLAAWAVAVALARRAAALGREERPLEALARYAGVEDIERDHASAQEAGDPTAAAVLSLGITVAVAAEILAKVIVVVEYAAATVFGGLILDPSLLRPELPSDQA
jgi:hypothetical protein